MKEAEKKAERKLKRLEKKFKAEKSLIAQSKASNS